MTIDLPPIPPAVVEFAKVEQGGKILYVREWKNYKVYRISYPKLEKGDWGLPYYILFDGKARWAKDEENDEIMYLNSQS